MKKIMIILSTAMFGAMASAKTMSCVIGVYKAADMVDENSKPEQTNQIVRVALKGNEGEKEVEINGETVSVELTKRTHADVYDLYVVLLTPKEDRPPKLNAVTSFSDFLISEGPAKNNGWTVDYKPGAVIYEFMQRRSGTFALTPKMRKALVEAGKWGEYPFNSSYMDPQYASLVGEEVKQLLNDKKLKGLDVVAFGTTFSCTLNKN